MPSLREQIQSLAKPKLVPVNFGGVSCFARKWNEGEQIAWAIECQGSKGDEGEPDLYLRCKAIVRSLCDESGELIYSADEFAEIAKQDPQVIDPVWETLIELQSRISGDDDAKKN